MLKTTKIIHKVFLLISSKPFKIRPFTKGLQCLLKYEHNHEDSKI
jgi:hypothetical protein